MSQTPIYSESGKYMYWTEHDPSNEKSTYYTYNRGGGEKIANERDKYKIVKIARVSDGEILFEYRRHDTTKTYHGFFSAAAGAGSTLPPEEKEEWFFGGPHYLSRLYFNCDTGAVWRQHETDDVETFDGYEYIWGAIHSTSPSGRYVLIDGCMWAFPYELRLYDLSRLTTDGPIEIDMYDYAEKSASVGIADVDYAHEFVSENEIIVYKRNVDGERDIVARVIGF